MCFSTGSPSHRLAVLYESLRHPDFTRNRSPLLAAGLFGTYVCAVGTCLKTRPVDNQNSSALCPDETTLLQVIDRNSHTRSAHSEHQSQELVRQRQFIAWQAVMG